MTRDDLLWEIWSKIQGQLVGYEILAVVDALMTGALAALASAGVKDCRAVVAAGAVELKRGESVLLSMADDGKVTAERLRKRDARDA